MLYICQSLRPNFLNTNNACGGAEPSCDDHIWNNGEWGLDCGGPCPTCVGGALPPCASSPQNTLPSGPGSLLNANPVPHKLIFDCLKGNLDGSANRIMGMSISVGTDDLFYHGGNVHLVAGTTLPCASAINPPWNLNVVLGPGIRVYPGGLRVIASDEDEIHMELKRFDGYGGVNDYDACPDNAPGWRLEATDNLEDQPDEERSFQSGKSLVNENYAKDIRITPNPNSGTFTISGADMHRVQLMEASGKLVREMKGPFGNAVEVSGLNSGLYIVRVMMVDGRVENEKVIVN